MASQDSPQTAGKVFFHPDAKTEYLFFKPLSYTPLLKVLEESMWFEKEDKDRNLVYRSVSSIESLEWLRSNLGPLTLSKEVHEWYVDQTTISVSTYPADAPIYPFQKEAISFLFPRSKAMLSLSPGLGKTLVSIMSADKTDARRVLVVAPVSLLYMWKAELDKWSIFLTHKPVIYIWHKKICGIQDMELPDKDQTIWVITNPETVVGQSNFFLSHRIFDLLILDESILYKNRKAKRTDTLTDLAKQIQKTWLLTGAPATRMLDDLWSQFHLLNPKAYSSYWRFAKEYCIVTETPWGAKVTANKYKSEDKIKKRFRDIYLARSQEEVLDIPDWLFEDIDIPMTVKQEKIYHSLAADLSVTLHNEDSTKVITVGNHLSLVIRLLQAASNPVLMGGENTSGKWEAIPELLKLYPAPYVVWTSFIESAKSINEMLRGLKLDSFFMLGETPPAERQNIVDAFQAGKLDAVVLGQAVGSFGITLTAARTAIYLERNFDGSYFQSLYRIRRIGTTQRPVVINLRSVRKDGKRTIDHVVHEVLDYRVNMIRDLTVGMLKGI
jgi:SNF2 family DNA or RNA helicase